MLQNENPANLNEAMVKAEETISLLRTKISLLEKQNSKLETENQDLSQKLTKAQEEIRLLKIPQNADGRFEIFRFFTCLVLGLDIRISG